MDKKEQSTKKSRSKIILIVFLIICIFGLIVSAFKIITYLLETNKTKAQLSDIYQKTQIVEEEDNSDTETIGQQPEDNPYWDYVKIPLSDVDFSELTKINSDTKAWLSVASTNINYPVVQANDNNFYLNHSFDHTYNSAGWVFFDYRNDLSNPTDHNTIVYAHGRLDQTMFGTLNHILKPAWLSDQSNHTIKLSSPYQNSLWQVFSVYQMPATTDYLRTEFAGDNDFLTFINSIKARSVHNFPIDLSVQDRILTLSTCSGKNDRIVLHAKLIKHRDKK